MEIRLLEEKDAEQYWELRLTALQTDSNAFLTTYEEALSRKNAVEETAKKLASTSSFTFGAFEGNKLVGVVTVVTHSPAKINHKADLLAMYVAKEFRKTGIGKRLIEVSIDHAKNMQMEQLQLTVVSTNKKAKSLYKSLGFKTYGKEHQSIKLSDGTYLDEEDMVLFIK